MLKKFLTIFLILVSILPLCSELSYWISSWKNSPLEKWNWIFVLLFFVMICFQCARKLQNQPTYSWDLFPFVISFLSIFMYGNIKNIHALCIISAIFLLWSSMSLIFGWRWGFKTLSVFCILSLATPSLSFYFSSYTGFDALLVKITLAIILFIVFAAFQLCKRIPTLGNSIFYGLCILLVVAFFCVKNNFSIGMPMTPVFSRLRFGKYIGAPEDISAADRRFFGNSKIDRYVFSGDVSQQIHVLELNKIDNIHNIHPAGYCLRAGGAKIIKEHKKMVHIQPEIVFSVQETIFEESDRQFICWQWYSSDHISSESFLFFRHSFVSSEPWRVIQIVMPIINDGYSATLEVLTDFIKSCIAG